MKLLHFDIETRPATVRVWSIYKPHIDVDQILEPTSVLCFAALWDGDSPDKVIFAKSQRVDSHEFRQMIRLIHKLLTEADAVCHFNGDSFDLPMLNQEFTRMGLPPVPKIHSIDLKKVVWANYRLVSSRLKFVAPYFGIGQKVEHEGWPLWNKCLAGDQDAWRRMQEYNIGDVVLLPDLYKVLRPWIKPHPNMALFGAPKRSCPTCGSVKLDSRGLRRTHAHVYRRLQCRDCGAWSRERARDKSVATPELCQ